MSKFRAVDVFISQKGFSYLPKIGSIAGGPQPNGSFDSGSISSHASNRRGHQLQEGDLITGTIDVVHERAHMLSAIRDNKHTEEREGLEQHIVGLKVIPPAYRKIWTLNHGSNTTWLSLPFHRHHDTYATILIAPSSYDSNIICDKLDQDNALRRGIIKEGRPDPGRDENINWFEGTKGGYELVILRPDHFLVGNYPVVIKHPVTQDFARFYPSRHEDGFLHEGSPTGPPLLSFCSRGNIDRDIPLNPILVNFAAMIRFRRLIRQNPMWGSKLDPYIIKVLRNIVALHAAVYWRPYSVPIEQFIVQVQDPGSQQPSSRDLREWPYFPKTTNLTPSTTESNLGTEISTPTALLDRAFVLLEAGFEELPDLGDSHSRHDLSSELGVMNPQEKMEKFLRTFAQSPTLTTAEKAEIQHNWDEAHDSDV